MICPAILRFNKIGNSTVATRPLHGRFSPSAVLIKKHDKSYIVKLEDGSSWRIWPGDIALTLQWSPTRFSKFQQ
jgi:hypothetical protein